MLLTRICFSPVHFIVHIRCQLLEQVVADLLESVTGVDHSRGGAEGETRKGEREGRKKKSNTLVSSLQAFTHLLPT